VDGKPIAAKEPERIWLYHKPAGLVTTERDERDRPTVFGNLPSTGWLRRYRVRINGSVSEAKLDRLREGITVEGVSYQPMTVTFDRQQGANAWLTIAIREGKNREIRRAMSAQRPAKHRPTGKNQRR